MHFEDTVEHVICHCPVFDPGRLHLAIDLSTLPRTFNCNDDHSLLLCTLGVLSPLLRKTTRRHILSATARFIVNIDARRKL